MKELITIAKLKEIFKKKNYVWNPLFNHIGIRTLDQTPDVFNDYFVVVYKDQIIGIYEGTTDPGVYWLKTPSRVNGTAILPEGQYLDTWQIGVHKTYPAWTQFKQIFVWRDNNKDEKVDYAGTKVNDVSGLNIHHGHATWLSNIKNYLLKVIKIGQYSAACQVYAFKDNHDTLMEYTRLTKFKLLSYTLLNEIDFK